MSKKVSHLAKAEYVYNKEAYIKIEEGKGNLMFIKKGTEKPVDKLMMDLVPHILKMLDTYSADPIRRETIVAKLKEILNENINGREISLVLGHLIVTKQIVIVKKEHHKRGSILYFALPRIIDIMRNRRQSIRSAKKRKTLKIKKVTSNDLFSRYGV